ncbi:MULTISPECIES: LexA family transcriptional regulator [Halomonadaceae]|uniref:LexA family protein n=1 Tax=Halomonadaceae TaxID=28256 RepID=UPI00159B80B3|nr:MULTISPECIES: S24 family peptidase [Halomonas]QJQ95722.1 LexA family transcriptional regulator [Halomonas sp. PA5]
MHIIPLPQMPAIKAPPGPTRRGASGFPSPADEYLETPLDLHRHLIPRPSSTFFMRVADATQSEAGFHPGDLLVVDRALSPQPGDWVIAVIDGGLCLRRIEGLGRQRWLCPPEPQRARLPLEEESDCRLWGVVHHVIHNFRHASRTEAR